MLEAKVEIHRSGTKPGFFILLLLKSMDHTQKLISVTA
jgi:hypothetical protein